VATPSQTNRVSATLILGMAALSLVVLTGWSGTVSLGQAGLVGVGGVVAANLIARANLDLFLTIIASAAAGAAVAVLIGLPAFRVKGMFLAVTTLAFAVAMESYLVNPTNFPQWIPGSYDRPVLWKHIDLRGEQPMYYLCLAALVAVVLVVHTTLRTRTGRVLRATRDNARAAAAMAVPTARVQLTGFVLAGVIAGSAGALHATLLRGVGYQTYPVATSILVFSMAVIGGISSLAGTLVGVAFVQGLILAVPRLALVFTGAALLIVLYAAPGGIGQLLEGLRDQVVRRLAGRRGIELVEGCCGPWPGSSRPPAAGWPSTAPTWPACRPTTSRRPASPSCPAGAACSRPSPSTRTCGWPPGCSAPTRPPQLPPGTRCSSSSRCCGTGSGSWPATCPAASSRCCRWP
jgi:branched-chain amino acid transport system permease protein